MRSGSRRSGMDDWTQFDGFLASIDRDGALAETRSRADRAISRRSLLGLALIGTGAIAAARAPAAAAGLSASDMDILNYALVLEYLQSSFYTEAERSGALSGKTAEAARIVGATER